MTQQDKPFDLAKVKGTTHAKSPVVGPTEAAADTPTMPAHTQPLIDPETLKGLKGCRKSPLGIVGDGSGPLTACVRGKGLRIEGKF